MEALRAAKQRPSASVDATSVSSGAKTTPTPTPKTVGELVVAIKEIDKGSPIKAIKRTLSTATGVVKKDNTTKLLLELKDAVSNGMSEADFNNPEHRAKVITACLPIFVGKGGENAQTKRDLIIRFIHETVYAGKSQDISSDMNGIVGALDSAGDLQELRDGLHSLMPSLNLKGLSTNHLKSPAMSEPTSPLPPQIRMGGVTSVKIGANTLTLGTSEGCATFEQAREILIQTATVLDGCKTGPLSTAVKSILPTEGQAERVVMPEKMTEKRAILIKLARLTAEATTTSPKERDFNRSVAFLAATMFQGDMVALDYSSFCCGLESPADFEAVQNLRTLNLQNFMIPNHMGPLPTEDGYKWGDTHLTHFRAHYNTPPAGHSKTDIIKDLIRFRFVLATAYAESIDDIDIEPLALQRCEATIKIAITSLLRELAELKAQLSVTESTPETSRTPEEIDTIRAQISTIEKDLREIHLKFMMNPKVTGAGQEDLAALIPDVRPPQISKPGQVPFLVTAKLSDAEKGSLSPTEIAAKTKKNVQGLFYQFHEFIGMEKSRLVKLNFLLEKMEELNAAKLVNPEQFPLVMAKIVNLRDMQLALLEKLEESWGSIEQESVKPERFDDPAFHTEVFKSVMMSGHVLVGMFPEITIETLSLGLLLEDGTKVSLSEKGRKEEASPLEINHTMPGGNRQSIKLLLVELTVQRITRGPFKLGEISEKLEEKFEINPSNNHFRSVTDVAKASAQEYNYQFAVHL